MRLPGSRTLVVSMDWYARLPNIGSHFVFLELANSSH